MLPRRKFLSPSTTRRPKDQSDRLGSTEKIEKEGEVRLLLQRRRDQPTLGAVGKSSTVGQGDTTRSGWASCDSPAIFATSLHPGHHQGKLPGSGSGETCGSGYHHTSDSTEIPSGGHRLGCVLGNVKHVVTEGSQGFLEEKEGCWIRHHIQPRRLLFHPAGAPGGPNCHELREERVTIMNGMEKRDKWNIRGGQDEEWCGQTIFYKKRSEIKNEAVKDKFIQPGKLASQGGFITFFCDARMETQEKAYSISIVNWKSFRIKQCTINTLSAECQAMLHGVGALHWLRFLIQEVEVHDKRITLANWENALSQVPCIAVTDSKSLYDITTPLANAVTLVPASRTRGRPPTSPSSKEIFRRPKDKFAGLKVPA